MSGIDEFSGIYRRISEHVATALDDISGISISSEKGRTHLGGLQNQLNALKVKFDGEISYLDKNAEWEKLTIAFFGETGAGKSTIIESLRVIFSERERQAKIAANQASYEVLQQEFSRESDHLIEGLKSQYTAVANDALALGRHIGDLAAAVREESQATADVFRASTESINQTLNEHSSALDARLDVMAQSLARLSTANQIEQSSTRDSFTRDSENLIAALRHRGASLDAELAQLAASISTLAGVARVESEVERRAQRRRIVVGLLVGVAGGIALGVLGFGLLAALR